MKRRRIGIVLVILLLLTGGSAAYIGQYYHADADCLQALASDASVNVERTGYGWYFDGPSEDNALIFYPGGKVEETAYAPMLHLLAQEGMDVCLVKVPGRLAFLGIRKADEAMGAHRYENWYVGGHSLGGDAAEHGDALRGIVLLGSYSTKKLSEDLKGLLVYGSEDCVLNRGAYEKNRGNVPAATEIVIKGGNHAQFGSYGVQKGDGKALISAREQWEETVRAVMEFAR